MVTEPMFAYQVEHPDNILVDGVQHLVTGKEEEVDHILLNTKDEDGDTSQLPFGPFDTVHVIVSFD